MRCYICDAVLHTSEISENPDHGDFDPCGKCQQIIDEVFEPLSEEEVAEQLEKEQDDDFLLDKSDE